MCVCTDVSGQTELSRSGKRVGRHNRCRKDQMLGFHRPIRPSRVRGLTVGRTASLGLGRVGLWKPSCDAEREITTHRRQARAQAESSAH
ncbi:unnamed protein product [Protopolystoma xenopodis]|uniref:Uncharacterized protein n=1 Tax=Protopolystoma xenopodis TaxID=117903 RepID=A0A3S5A6V0_9PLAT|nr:unnamed protein product [Protopolystoma xenopodis]